MGLDAVELVMAIEETFDLRIPNAEAARMLTVREMIDYVASRKSTVPSARCSTQQAFHAVRRALRSASSWTGPITPDTPLTAFADRERWPNVWRRARSSAAADPRWPRSVPWKSWLRDGPRTVGELVLYVTSMPRPVPHPRDEPWTRDDITRTVRQVLCHELGIWNARLDDSFVKDLGLS